MDSKQRRIAQLAFLKAELDAEYESVVETYRSLCQLFCPTTRVLRQLSQAIAVLEAARRTIVSYK